MPDIVITIPTGQAARVQAAFAERAGVPDPNDVTLDDVKNVLRSLIVKIVKQHELDVAEKGARETVTEVTPT